MFEVFEIVLILFLIQKNEFNFLQKMRFQDDQAEELGRQAESSSSLEAYNASIKKAFLIYGQGRFSTGIDLGPPVNCQPSHWRKRS